MNPDLKRQRDKNYFFLVGMMGTGKSTIGKILAKRLEIPFMDSDSEIEKYAGRSISEIFSNQGEVVFRDLEKKFVTDLLPKKPAIVACGGGLCIPEGMMELLKSRGHVIALLANAETLLKRTQKDSSRPLLQVAQPLMVLEKLVRERDARYREADTLINTDGELPEQIVENIIKHATG